MHHNVVTSYRNIYILSDKLVTEKCVMSVLCCFVFVFFFLHSTNMDTFYRLNANLHIMYSTDEQQLHIMYILEIYSEKNIFNNISVVALI